MNQQPTTSNQQPTTNNQQPATCLRVGITGGIGSGKTTVCQIFESLGVPVYYADIGAKWLLNNDEEIIKGVKQIFGEPAYTAEGSYDRLYVASVAFTQPDKLAALNALVHPAVERHSRAWHDDWARTGDKRYTLKEAALMIESGGHLYLDQLIVVTAPEALRVQRVVQRDGLAEEQVYARIKSQLPEEEKVRLADFVIRNDGTQLLIQQVWAIHKKLTGN